MIDYRDTGYDVRDDIMASQNRAWQALARPGTWWSGAERVAIAREARAARECGLCKQRKAALSPYSVTGTHDAATGLTSAVVEAAHRIATDPGRLSRRWFDETLADGLTDTHFVELVSVVCTLTIVDSFARTIGAEPPALPTPEPGEPARVRPPAAIGEGAWVPTIPGAVGESTEIGLYEPGAFTPNVGRGLSLVPAETRAAQDLMLAHYMPYHVVVTDFEPEGRAIDRTQIELIAGRVSAKNDCFY